MVCRRGGVLVCWCVEEVVCWCVGVARRWCVGLLALGGCFWASACFWRQVVVQMCIEQSMGHSNGRLWFKCVLGSRRGTLVHPTGLVRLRDVFLLRLVFFLRQGITSAKVCHKIALKKVSDNIMIRVAGIRESDLQLLAWWWLWYWLWNVNQTARQTNVGSSINAKKAIESQPTSSISSSKAIRASL